MERTVLHKLSGLPVTALRLEVLEGPDAGMVHVARTDTATVGTAPGNDLVLTDETVSRYHLEVQRHQDRIHVRDHGSTNGVVLAGATLERATVAPGTVLQLGRTQLRVSDGGRVELELFGEDSFFGLRGRTPKMRNLMARLDRAAKTEVSALLLGETGTGKELIARALHEASPRAGAPFEVVDCGALMPTLIASELFGHERGAFTGADRQHIGAFERAHRGTLFLDEIGELPAALQSALLGALERRAFRRVGGHDPIHVDVRVICATNRDLRSEVNAGRFRQDLYYRIAVVLLHVPALRERLDDLPVLVEHFLREAGHDGPLQAVVPTSVMQSLRAHHWPGNVRELKNFVDAALAMGEAPALEPSEDRAPSAEPVAPAPAGTAGRFFLEAPLRELFQLSYKDARASLLHDFETLYLADLMQKARHNVSKAARDAEMNRSYLIEMLKRHGIR